jgi:ribonuclease P protein component
LTFTFEKSERLKNAKLIERLFAEGKRVKSFPLQMVYLQIDHPENKLMQVAFSVSKKQFKNAVDRNLLKRHMREAYRLHNKITFDKLDQKHIAMFIFTGKEIKDYHTIEKAVKRLLSELSARKK